MSDDAIVTSPFIAFRKTLIAFGVTGCAAALGACSSNQDNGPTDASTSPSTDAPSNTVGDSAPNSDAGADATSPDAGDSATSDVVVAPVDAACAVSAVDAQVVQGIVQGLPTIDVPVSPPVVTPQVAVDPPSNNFQKEIGVLSLSGTVQDVQSVVHILKPMGLPFAITTAPKLSIQHDMVIFFPEADPSSFDGTTLNLIKQYVQEGGVIVMKYSEVDDLKALGGVKSAAFGNPLTRVTLTTDGQTEFPSLDDPLERTMPLGGEPDAYINSWAMTLDDAATSAVALATFEDGSPAIVKNAVGSGAIYTFGIDYRDIIVRNQLGHSIDAARGYINVFEPGTDSWMLMLRDIYDAHVRFGVRIASAPDGLRAPVLFSHDLDWGFSYDNALVYAQEEKNRGGQGTYFIHTKYVTDAQDNAFFTGERGAQIAQILAMGHNVGSHTVAHSPVLNQFPIGTGTEAYPSYQPYNTTATQTTGATLFGELRVSKSLIDGFLGTCGHETVAFRAGNLSYNYAAPQTMERMGYKVDSTRAIGDTLSAFPYRAMTDWPDALDTSVFEIPISIEDETAPRFDNRVPATLGIIAANAANGAPTTVLVHPNVLDYKLQGERNILDGLPPDVKAIGLETFAAFWRARDGVRIKAVDYDDGPKKLTVTVTTTDAIAGLTLRVGAIVDSVSAPAGAKLVTVTGGEKRVTLPALKAGDVVPVVMQYH